MATRGPLTWERLVAAARRVGVKVVEAPSSHRGHLGSMGSVVGVVEHTTGTPNSYRPDVDYPDFNVVKEGRKGLNNSLSALGIGRFDAIYVFSEFLSWHTGVWEWHGITDGNGHFLGIECAGVGDYTDFQRRVYPRLVAAVLLEVDGGRDMAPRHLDGAMPRGRKVDAQGFDGDFYQGRSFWEWLDFFLANPEHININYGGGFLMALSDAQQQEIYDKIVGLKLDYRVHHHHPVDDILGHVLSIRQEVAKLTPGWENDHNHGEVYLELIKLLPGVENLHPHGEVYNLWRGIATSLSAIAEESGTDVDEDALAAAIVAGIPESLADKVLDALKARL